MVSIVKPIAAASFLPLALVALTSAGCGAHDARTLTLELPRGETAAQRDAVVQVLAHRVMVNETFEDAGKGSVTVKLPAGADPADAARRLTGRGLVTLTVGGEARPALAGADFYGAVDSRDAQGRSTPMVSFSAAGTRRFAAVVRRHPGRRVRMRLAVDGRVVQSWSMRLKRSWLTAKRPISGFTAVGPMPRPDAERVIAYERSGVLTAPVRAER
jgi:hypothetical protein